MKKIFSYVILFIPWNISLIIIYFCNLNLYSLIYIIFSFLFYILLAKYLYYIIKRDLVNSDNIFYISLLYIVNQSFNLCLFYYKFIFLSIILFISILIILCKLKNT